MKLHVEEGMAGQHHGASARGHTERPHHPYLCFSWFCKHHFFLTSTAAKNNHVKLMADTRSELLKLHWSFQHGMPKELLIAHIKLMSSRFLLAAEVGQVILIVEAFTFSCSSDFLEEGQL